MDLNYKEDKDMTYITSSPMANIKKKEQDIVIVGDIFGDQEFQKHKIVTNNKLRNQTAKAVSQVKVMEF